ncbi:sigma factor G inhibitor Gin [Alteribacillus iranensis]|uniref:Inhibitor of sigma-G Gin n=1 Tax=Alteribacillus iranensis TaxID=930128 RepID=A0A1I2FCY8_9BACI|nr:sigma factor G inhibitor Gin [Alteribacillus iranensis]SFF03095.1 Inhibitor of sigma-G Gin [Alteribacillus iranensis]
MRKETENWSETCILCEEEKQKGIHIMQSFLCKECERHLVQLDPEHPKYKTYIVKLRKLKASTLYS